MPKKLSRSIAAIILIMLTVSSTVYAEPQRQETIPYGPRILNLKGKDEILRNLQQVKVTRTSLININITERTTDEELDDINRQLELYLSQLYVVRNNLEKLRVAYKDSIPDVLFIERIYFIANCFIISITSQQDLVEALRIDKANAVRLIYSYYLIPVYYYMTLGDQVIAYIERYIVIA